jgi:tetratricopeptide (TPR) repeat protein
LFVISRNSTFAYKGKADDIRQIARELGVRYVLEGSIQRAGDQVRINAQLIDAISGGHVWADRYDGPISNVFELQDKVTYSITDALALRLTTSEQQSIGRSETAVPAAYDAFLRGWEHFRRATPEDYGKAIPYFEQAVKLDPEYGRAYAALALTYWAIGFSDWFGGAGLSDRVFLADVSKYLREAEKHPTSTSHQVVGNLATLYSEFPKAIGEFKTAIALDPTDSWSYAYMASTLTFAGRPAEALQYIETAMRVDPRYPPTFLFFLGFAQYSLEQFEDAAVSFEKATKLNPGDENGFLFLGATYGQLGRKQEAMSAIAAYDALARAQDKPPLTARRAWYWWAYLERSDRDRLFDGLISAGVPDVMPASP